MLINIKKKYSELRKQFYNRGRKRRFILLCKKHKLAKYSVSTAYLHKT